MNAIICYCFEYTVNDIKADYNKNGESLILERIAAEKSKTDAIVLTRIPKAGDA